MTSEKEKMISGLPYLAYGEELAAMHLKAKELTYDFNLLHPSQFRERTEILSKLFGKVGKNCNIEAPIHCDYGCFIEIGDDFFANYNLTVLDCALVTIGNHVLIGPNTSLFCAGHPVHPDLRLMEVEYSAPITIEDNAWIGGNVVVNAGVTIGKNSVIGSGSVVTKDIPANVIAAGNPCRVLRPITEEDRNYYYKNKKYEV